ncbi:MAG TPA: DUF2842 domain-containing protein [Devosia sp.]|nr:DUF2842 domain-containing protein [Devosia sp.]
MNQSGRKLIGTVGLIVLLVAYPLAVAGLLGGWLATLPGWASIPVFIVLGMAWFFPAAWVIRWMVRRA